MEIHYQVQAHKRQITVGDVIVLAGEHDDIVPGKFTVASIDEAFVPGVYDVTLVGFDGTETAGVIQVICLEAI